MLKRQLIITRDRPFDPETYLGYPAARDLETLDFILRTLEELWYHMWQMDFRGGLIEYLYSVTPQRRGIALDPNEDRDEVAPVPEWLDVSLRRMLLGDVSYGRVQRQATRLGLVDGSDFRLSDYSFNGIPAAEIPWGRAFVLTTWDDLGSGGSEQDVKWISQIHRFFDPIQVIFHHPRYQRPKTKGDGRVGEVYEAYDGVAHGTPYVLVLSEEVLRLLAEVGK
ncbi:hypothetical protein C8A03DRAFT_34904 [Achaetomium macrosporum]|uniref:Uncharacterized protein n=1 Tax=Achaetomium macrosporum TaxID=79813 RepID=A0AAN7C9C7_9PEZI|nr:hypothetical protein C8A03DRAFT_34904 [Achaetomium macrosporum]